MGSRTPTHLTQKSHPKPTEAPPKDGRLHTRIDNNSSQLPVSHWHESIGDPTSADAIHDRLIHKTYRVELKGESMRKWLAEDTPD